MADFFTHRSDPAVPSFDDAGHVIFVDGECALCARSARLVAQADKQEIFKIATVQSPLGQAVLRHYGLDPNDPASWLYLRDGEAFKGAHAILEAARALHGHVRLLRLAVMLPAPFREWLYGLVARNRIKWFGQGDLCALPDPQVKMRLI